MWGTASPIKAIGPQNAVVTAVSKPVLINNTTRTRRTLIPRFPAYRSPNKSAFNGFINNNARSNPTDSIPQKTATALPTRPKNRPFPTWYRKKPLPP